MVALVIVTAFVAYYAVYKEERFSVPIEKTIERSIPMKELENKFEVFISMGLGGAGAGGLGAPQIKCFSPEQFLSQVPPEEKIYSAISVGYTGCDSCGMTTINTYRKQYWAFIENRAGLIIYEKIYYYSGWTIERYDENNIYFYSDNAGNSILISAVATILVLIAEMRITSTKSFKTWIKQKKEGS